jgi:hypothetical protein
MAAANQSFFSFCNINTSAKIKTDYKLPFYYECDVQRIKLPDQKSILHIRVQDFYKLVC